MKIRAVLEILFGFQIGKYNGMPLDTIVCVDVDKFTYRFLLVFWQLQQKIVL